jgi:hypothetical protein
MKNRVDERGAEFLMRLHDDVRPMPSSVYAVDCRLNDLEQFLQDQEQDMKSCGGVMELNPDFQRGHVWQRFQQVRYMESFLRKIAPDRIFFNCPSYQSPGAKKKAGDIPEGTFQCVDGLQRLTAVRAFVAGEFRVFAADDGSFEGYSADDLKGTSFDPRRYTLKICVFEFDTRAELLQFYVDLNRGGVAHSDEEIQRVKELMASAKVAAA